jgi:hypothetical protein
MNIFGRLVKALIRDNPHELTLQYRAKLEWTVTQFRNSEEDYPITLGALLRYDEKNGKCPPTINDLRSFVEDNPQNDQSFVKQAEIIMSELEALDEDTSEVPSDAEAMMNTAFDKGLAHYDITTYENAARIAAGEGSWPKKDGKTGPDSARMYAYDRYSKRLSNTPRGHSGDFVSNLAAINREVDLYLGGADEYRIKTKFKGIDSKVLIGPKHQKWIGLMGYTNHGKSGFLMSMLYNMAMEGAKVLLVPREFPVMEAWQRLLWMHAEKFPNEPLIDLQQWKGGGISDVSTWKAKEEIAKSLKAGGMKGSIDVQPFSTWEQIEEWLLVRSYKDPVDVLAVDYIGHLHVEGNQYDELNKVFRKAQMLTINGIRNDGNGMVVITPLQVNKKHYEAAADETKGESYGLYTPAAVDYFSQAARDMDLLISIWSEGTLLLESPQQAQLQCVKARGERFPVHRVEIEGISRHYRDIELKTEEKEIELKGAAPKEPVAQEVEGL